MAICAAPLQRSCREGLGLSNCLRHSSMFMGQIQPMVRAALSQPCEFEWMASGVTAAPLSPRRDRFGTHARSQTR